MLHLVLPSKVDPLVNLMKVEKVPDSTYDMIGGLDQQIKEIKEVSYMRASLYDMEALNRKGTGTKKCDCPFKIIGVKLTSNDDWSVKVVCGFHNHQAASNYILNIKV